MTLRKPRHMNLRRTRTRRQAVRLFLENFRPAPASGLHCLARWLLAVYWRDDPYRDADHVEEALAVLGINIVETAFDDDNDEREQVCYPTLVSEKLTHLEKQPDLPEPLAGNVEQLITALDLPEKDARVFRLLLAIHFTSPLISILSSEDFTFTQSVKVLAWFLGMPDHEVLEVVRVNGPLESAGVMIFDRADNTWSEHFSFPSHVVSFIDMEGFTPESMLVRLVREMPAPILQDEDFVHLGDDLLLLHQALAAALKSHRPGMNILLHGRPGTGKTQLAQWLVTGCGARGMEVPAQNMTDHRERDDRFRLYRLVQRLLPKDTWQVVLFDEVEDVFAQWGKRNTTKAGVNHVLETNPVPAIWITNDIHCMDDAFLRRFDIVLNLKSPPASQRERILAEAIAPMQLPRNMLKAIAAHPEVTPAIITRAALVVKTCTPVETMSKQASERVLRLVNGTLTSQGCSPVQLKKKNRKADTYRMETPYDLAHVNTSIALPELACALRETGEGRVCLFGPPGTGKSAFVHELARQMKRKLIVCQPSDIQDKYLGETEKNMAQKFKEARKKKAILFFDEFDSFLMTREMHSRTWETSQVNEMLTQIERFNGILFAATNHRTVIDKAAMRRFDFKVDFNWMKPEQAYGLFCKVLQAHGGPQTPDGVWQQQLAGLPQLSPGDFAVAARQARLMGKREGALTPEKLFSVLQAEVQAKRIEGESRPMGFLATLQ